MTKIKMQRSALQIFSSPIIFPSYRNFSAQVMGKRLLEESEYRESELKGSSKSLGHETKLLKFNNHQLLLERDLLLPGPDFRQSLVKPRDHIPVTSEIEELDHSAIHLAHLVEDMVTKFQWLKDVDLTRLSSSVFKGNHLACSLLEKYRVRFATHMVQQYWKGEIPLFDDIISTRRPSADYAMAHVRGSDLSAERLDDLQAHILEAATKAVDKLKRRKRLDADFFQKTSEKTEMLRLLSMEGGQPENTEKVTARDPNEYESSNSGHWPPPLPVIDDEELVKQIFTHRSAIMDASLPREALLDLHNERLEFKGDSVLDFIICDILYNTFPQANEGILTKMKASLVCNDTLFDLSVAYNLHERLQVSPDLWSRIYGTTQRPVANEPHPKPSNSSKAISDLFEAYIAAVSIDKGLVVVDAWLRKLYAPLVANLDTEEEEVDKTAKNELYRKIGSAEQPIKYESQGQGQGPPFTVVCTIDGKVLGSGTDQSQKIAGLKAAQQVLKQRDIVELYASKRRALVRTAPSTVKD